MRGIIESASDSTRTESQVERRRGHCARWASLAAVNERGPVILRLQPVPTRDCAPEKGPGEPDRHRSRATLAVTVALVESWRSAAAK
jgi:hypothetical protein